jgi:cell division protein FtsB
LKALLVILILLFGYLQYKLWVAEGKIQDSWALEQRIETLQTNNQKLLQRNNALQAEVDNLKSGKDVIEEKARQELGLIGKDETFFQYIESYDKPER